MATEARKTRGDRRSRRLALLPSRYEIGEEIGRGGVGVVYRAYDPALDRHVAVKALGVGIGQPDALARLRREAINAARLHHPNIAVLYEFEQSDEQAVLVMEYIDGPSLRQLLHEGPLDASQALRVLEQVAAALDYAHSLGIVHRDVKPSNILDGPGERAVLIDFGLARSAEDIDITSDAGVIGTPHYLSPEQARGLPADANSDIYALGAVAYELLTGAPPFQGRGAAASVVHAQLYELPPPPSERNPALSPSVDAVLLRALAKSPHDRYPSAAAFVAALRAALHAPPARPPRRGLWLALAFAAALIGAVLLALLLRPESRPLHVEPSLGEGVPVPRRVAWSQPINLAGGPDLLLSEGTLLVGTLDGALIGFDAKSGLERWRKQAASGTFGPAVLGPGLLFAGHDHDEVVALSPESGGLIWRARVEGQVREAPSFAENRLLVTTSKGYLYVLQPGSGLPLWSRPLGGRLGRASAAGELLFVPLGTRLYALDLGDGMLRWERDFDAELTTQPVAAAGQVLIGTERGALYALDAASGAPRWRYQARGPIRFAPAVADKLLLVADDSGALVALELAGGDLAWSFASGVALSGTPALADELVIASTLDGRVLLIEAASGGLRARYQLDSGLSGPALPGQGLIFVRSDDIVALAE
jgi:outer membrane protein assembly factor BamB/predicted Ser/Thr protein kinase